MTCAAIALAAATAAGAVQAATLQVGPGRALPTLAQAAQRAQDGDTVEVDAGTYRGDVALWQQDRLTLRAVGGRVRLLADGASMEGKAIWVVRGRHATSQVTVDGFDFEGSRVASRNGAGIRFEAGRLLVRNCRFFDNEMGLLTSNDRQAELTVENSEFARNLRPDGHNHNLYVGSIGRLSVRGSYFHHATIGHLLKSRAAVSHIFYNRLVDGPGGMASYELEFPNGGVAVVVGNVIRQGPATDNPIMISYGAEGYKWPVNTLVLAHNTLVDDLPRGGSFLRVARGDVRVKAVNNLLLGPGAPLDSAAPGDYRGNLLLGLDATTTDADGNVRLAASARLPGPLADAGTFEGLPLSPTEEPAVPIGSTRLTAPARLPGALQRPAAP